MSDKKPAKKQAAKATPKAKPQMPLSEFEKLTPEEQEKFRAVGELING
jgi:hypothetical protein